MKQVFTRFVEVLSMPSLARGDWLQSLNLNRYKAFQNWENVTNFLLRSQSSNNDHVEITLRTLGDKQYVLKKPIAACVDRISSDEVVAMFPEAGISICGNSATEAIQLLRTEIAESYVILKKEAKLGPEPQRQLLVLEGYIGQKRG